MDGDTATNRRLSQWCALHNNLRLLKVHRKLSLSLWCGLIAPEKNRLVDCTLILNRMHMTTDVCAPRSILPTHPYARTISYGTDVLTHERTPTHRHVYTHITGTHALPYLWFDYFDLKYYYAGFLGITLRAINFYTHLAPKVDTIVTSPYVMLSRKTAHAVTIATRICIAVGAQRGNKKTLTANSRTGKTTKANFNRSKPKQGRRK